MDLLTGEDGGKAVVVAGTNLMEDSPVTEVEEVEVELKTGGLGETDGRGLPFLLEFDEEEVVADLGLGEK